MPESECAACGDMCIHTDNDEVPLCDLCQEALVWKSLLCDIALGAITVPDEFIDTIGEESPPLG